MTETAAVLIKEIDKYRIWLTETDAYEFNFRSAIMGTGIFIIIMLFLYVISIALDSPPTISYLIIIMGTLFPLATILAGAYDKTIPSYKVNSGYYMGSEIIHKTNPEDDQIAICKAVKKLEQNILNKIEEDNKLEIIAAKCR